MLGIAVVLVLSATLGFRSVISLVAVMCFFFLVVGMPSRQATFDGMEVGSFGECSKTTMLDEKTIWASKTEAKWTSKD